MPSIVMDSELKKKFEGIRGKFLSTELFEDLTRAETLELMIDVLNHKIYISNPNADPIDLFDKEMIEQILKERIIK